MSEKRVTLFGGTGFIGRAIARQLKEEGWTVRIACRDPLEAEFCDEALHADILNPASLPAALEGMKAAINATALYHPEGGVSFEAFHVQAAGRLAAQCRKADVETFIQLSGIGADPSSPSPYIAARGRGEEAVRHAFPGAIVLRPSAVFAPGDRFIGSLIDLVMLSPVIPLFGSGGVRLQPVFRGDLAKAAAAVLASSEHKGKTFELGGPEVFKYRALLEMLARERGRRRLFLPMPYLLWDLMAFCLSPLASPPVSEGMVALMKKDNVTSKGSLGFQSLVLPTQALSEMLARHPDWKS